MNRVVWAASCAAFVFLSLPLAPAAAADPAGLSPAQEAVLDAYAASLPASQHVHGVSIAVVRHGRLVYARAFGENDVAKQQPMDAETPFPLGSLTKQFTLVVARRLIDAGKIDPDAFVARYVPSAPHGGEIRVRDLIDQTSGLRDYSDDSDDPIARIVESQRHVAPEELTMVLRGKPLEFPPGSRFELSGSNYVVLGQIIEAVTGKPFADAVRESVAQPLGLRSVTLGAPASGTFAVGYMSIAPSVERAAVWRGDLAYANGGLFATPSDVARFTAALFGGAIFPKAELPAIFAPVAVPGGEPTNFRFGWWDNDGDREYTLVGHAPGVTAVDGWYPNQDVAVCVAANSIAFNGSPVVQQIVRIVDPATPLTSQEAQLARVKPAADPAVLAHARAEYDAWANGTVVWTHYSDAAKNRIHLYVDQITPALKAAGAPTSFELVRERRAPDHAEPTYVFRIVTPAAPLEMDITFGPDWSVEDIFFEPST